MYDDSVDTQDAIDEMNEIEERERREGTQPARTPPEEQARLEREAHIRREINRIINTPGLTRDEIMRRIRRVLGQPEHPKLPEKYWGGADDVLDAAQRQVINSHPEIIQLLLQISNMPYSSLDTDEDFQDFIEYVDSWGRNARADWNTLLGEAFSRMNRRQQENFLRAYRLAKIRINEGDNYEKENIGNDNDDEDDDMDARQGLVDNTGGRPFTTLSNVQGSGYSGGVKQQFTKENIGNLMNALRQFIAEMPDQIQRDRMTAYVDELYGRGQYGLLQTILEFLIGDQKHETPPSSPRGTKRDRDDDDDDDDDINDFWGDPNAPTYSIFGNTGITTGAGLSGGEMAADDIKDLLRASYDKEIKDIGDYRIDPELSDERVKAYVNDKTGKVYSVHRGSADWRDWLDNYNLVRHGNFRGSNTYKKHKAKQEAIDRKYGKENQTLLGHSRAGKYVEELNDESKGKYGEVFTYNKATNWSDIGRKNKKNQYDIRTKYDPVSALRFLQRGANKVITINHKSKNPLKAHSPKRLSLFGKKLIGKGMAGGKFNPKKLRVKEMRQFLRDHHKVNGVRKAYGKVPKKELVEEIKGLVDVYSGAGVYSGGGAGASSGNVMAADDETPNPLQGSRNVRPELLATLRPELLERIEQFVSGVPENRLNIPADDTRNTGEMQQPVEESPDVAGDIFEILVARPYYNSVDAVRVRDLIFNQTYPTTYRKILIHRS